MKKNLLAFGTCAFALALGLVACDDSTSANGSSGDENPAEESSSSVILSDSDIESSGTSSPYEFLSSAEEGSSSSVTSSSSVESSSSVVSSSSEKSSSSVASSSSVKSSSSVASSSSAKSSSSSVVSSSSSSSAPTEDPSDSKLAWQYLNPDIDYGEFTDTRDGQVYKTIKICDKENKNCQTWMAQNLNYNPGDVSSMGSYAWSGCYGDGGYDYSSGKNLTDEEVAANCSKYGRLYTWEVAIDKAGCGYGKRCNPSGTVQGVCPIGWHLPSDADWSKLLKNVGGIGSAGSELKSASGWNSNGNGFDSFGFAVLPAGYRFDDGYFNDEGNNAKFWSPTAIDYDYAYGWSFYYFGGDVNYGWFLKSYGLSVRCLRDSN